MDTTYMSRAALGSDAFPSWPAGPVVGRRGGRQARPAGAAPGWRGGWQARWTAGPEVGRRGGRQARRTAGVAVGRRGGRQARRPPLVFLAFVSPRPWFFWPLFHFCHHFFPNFVSYTLLLGNALLQNYSFQHAQTLPDRHIRRQ